MKNKKEKQWEKINIKPYQKERLDKMVEKDGRFMYKFIDILMDNYENNLKRAIIKWLVF